VTEHVRIEQAWTVTPCVILLAIAIPSITLLFKIADFGDPVHVTIKAIGNQWY
jgi:cytochrome c oxidase subunit 2